MVCLIQRSDYVCNAWTSVPIQSPALLFILQIIPTGRPPTCLRSSPTDSLCMRPSAKYIIPSFSYVMPGPVVLLHIILPFHAMTSLSWLTQFSAVNDGTSSVLKLSAHDWVTVNRLNTTAGNRRLVIAGNWPYYFSFRKWHLQLLFHRRGQRDFWRVRILTPVC